MLMQYRSVSLDDTTIDVAISVIRSTLEIQENFSHENIPSRNKALNQLLRSATVEQLRAWLVIFPRWLEGEIAWRKSSFEETAGRLQQIIVLELETEDDRDQPPARSALRLFAKPNAPPLPIEFLLKGLDRKRSVRNICADLLGVRKDDERELAIDRMREVLRTSSASDRCWRISMALGSLQATEAIPELKSWYGKTQFVNERHHALAALSRLDRPAAEQLLVLRLQGVRVFGSSFFLE